MTSTFLVTPGNWFDLPGHVAASAQTGASVDLTLADSGGSCPLADVPLDDLRGLHKTFGSWWHALSSDARPAGLAGGAYDRFLADSRALLKKKADTVLARPDAIDASTSGLLLAFPQLDHASLADPRNALALFQSFLMVWHSPSLLAWARTRARDADAVVQCEERAWLRLVLQKAAVEDALAEALDCLRAVYGGNDADRSERLSQESQLLALCELQHLQEWARSLGLDRPTRTEPGIRAPRRRGPGGTGEPDVTVLVPSFCHEAFIETTLESVLAQTHQAFRLLVVDDRSPDCTVERVSRVHDPRLQIQVNEQNLGLGDSVLRAVDTITTPYVALLNSDDLFHSERLDRCIAVLRASERINVVATGVMPIDDAGCLLASGNVRRLFDGANIADWIQWFSRAGHVDEGADLLSELLERNFLITSSNIVCRTESLRSSRDALEGLKYCFDWQVFLDAAIAGALAYVPDGLVGYRLHPSNTVWFDDARGAAYRLEVNRVLACALRRLLEPSSSRRNAEQLSRILDLLASHAAKHSEASGLLLYAIELLGDRTLEQIADRSEAGRTHLDLLSRSGRTTTGAQVGDALRAASNALRAIAEVSSEEASQARGSERWVREELGRAQAGRLEAEQEVARLRSLPEWRVGDALWNRARLSRVGLPAARAFRRLYDRRYR